MYNVAKGVRIILTIGNKSKSGFDVVLQTPKFKCALITRSEFDYGFGPVGQMKRHNDTDEVFVLLRGRAVVLIYEDGQFREYVLEPEKVYNVKASTWHNMGISEDAMVFVAENADIDPKNTDTLVLEAPYLLEE